MGLFAVLVAIVTIIVVNQTAAKVIQFPKDFQFGAALAAYQVEGAWDDDGKSPSIWDTLTHRNPASVADRSNGDVAADSYHMFQKDVDALSDIGFEVYRFSVSWSRVIPQGSKVNQKGIDYYSKLIDLLHEKKIEALVTIYHWDLPQYLQDLGGWTNPIIVDYFVQFADVLFEHFGTRVKRWITFNEPSVFCGEGYGYASKAPLIPSGGVGDYLCAHHVLLANAAVYRLYKAKYFGKQQGQVGICLNSGFNYVANESIDQNFAEKAQQFELGKFANPIFSKEGGYPQVMVDQIGNKSEMEGRPWSRLPAMTEAFRKEILGTADFLALNYYTSQLVKPREANPFLPNSWYADIDLEFSTDPSWKRAKSSWLYSVPQGLHDLLKWIKDSYGNPTVLITENGFSDDGQLEDNERVEYLQAHLASLVQAVNEGCNVIAYTAWSLTDNFEWMEGYTEKFGLHYINFTSLERERVPKKSAKFFKEFMLTKSFEF